MKKCTKLILLIVIIMTISIISCKKVTETEYNIDSKSCNSCGRCVQICPSGAMEFNTQGKAVIDQTKCIQCGKCVVACPQKAIY